MVSFFEKLKKGMGAGAAEQEHVEEQIKAVKKPKPARRRQKPNKLEIKIEKIDADQASDFAASSDKTAADTKTEKVLEKVEDNKEELEEKLPEKSRQSFAENLGGQEGQLAVDVYETNGELIIQSAIAGIKPQDLDISIENDRVLIRGERAEQSEEQGKNYFYQECYWGGFSREIMLPAETDPSRAQAAMKNGILTIRIPKISRERKRKIEVKS